MADFGIMSARSLEDAYSPSPSPEGAAIRQSIEMAFQPVRELIQQHTGPTIRLYRSQQPVTQDDARYNMSRAADGTRNVLSWTSERRVAEWFAGVQRRYKIYDEAFIQRAEQEYKTTGVATISKRIRLVRPEKAGKPYTGYFHGEWVENFMDFPEYPEIWEGDEMITDTDSVRSYIESENKDRLEWNAKQDKLAQAVIEADIPLTDVVWVSDRAGQWEFIVRNHPDSAGHVDMAGKLRTKGVMENTQKIKPVKERTFTMSIGSAKVPVIVGKIVGKLAWRRDVLPAIKKIAAEVAGKPVPWDSINIWSGPGDTEEEALTLWAAWEVRDPTPFPMYVISAPGQFRKVGGP